MSAHIPGIHAFEIIYRMFSARIFEVLTPYRAGTPRRSTVHGVAKIVVDVLFAGLSAFMTSNSALRVMCVDAVIATDETSEKAQRG